MELYESSTVTLRTIISHPPLQRDKIDETMDADADLTAVEEREAFEDAKRLGERLEEGKTPMDVPGALGEPKRAGPLKEGVDA
ncbi:hypothetical protein BDM02DRAFT_3118729 [Thelephora ganbajun]|uniref:Uncharacterized protein n=1 Tax=Thelephora ganbajun TaxID=370292 RepID=A0ACB6Z9Y7_THEGA|nr:hypothetical protein BDM02DRAFT_3118729 [Thelephora ganbajun]